MVSVMKSPNMMSTTGRSPVIAAPTATPVKPASEIGVSPTRAAPNSSTSPDKTLNGVPASATSSPKIHTRESRRISSASASRTACANVSSRSGIARSGINVFLQLIDTGIGRPNGEFHCGFHFRARCGGNLLERRRIRMPLPVQPVGKQLDGISLAPPMLLFLLRAVIFAIDVAHVMAAVAVGIGLEEGRAVARTSTLYQALCDFIHRAHILAVDLCRFQSEGRGAS